MDELEAFAKRFLSGRINWWKVPKHSSIINFGNIISFVIVRQPPFQVELFIVPDAPSSFTTHRHPNVDVIEFGLSGDSVLLVNGKQSYTENDAMQWLLGTMNTLPIRIKPTDYHSGYGYTPYTFLSIQHWLNGVQPSSVGLDWIGVASSVEQAMLLNAVEVQQHG